MDNDLDVFVRFARDAAEGKKEMVVTHSEVFPGTFASTTETADYLLGRLGLGRQATLAWGPQRTQLLSRVQRAGSCSLGTQATRRRTTSITCTRCRRS